MKLELSRQIFEKYSDTKFHENPSNGSRAVPCGRTDMKLPVASRNFANAPANWEPHVLNSPRSPVRWLARRRLVRPRHTIPDSKRTQSRTEANFSPTESTQFYHSTIATDAHHSHLKCVWHARSGNRSQGWQLHLWPLLKFTGLLTLLSSRSSSKFCCCVMCIKYLIVSSKLISFLACRAFSGYFYGNRIHAVIWLAKQIITSSYPGSSTSYQNGKYITVKLSKFLQKTGIITRTLQPSQFQTHTWLTTHNTLALPTLSYGCETWAIREQDKSRITSAKMKFMRTSKYTRKDYKTN